MFTPEVWEAVKTYRTQWRASVMRNPQPKDRFLKRQGTGRYRSAATRGKHAQQGPQKGGHQGPAQDRAE